MLGMTYAGETWQKHVEIVCLSCLGIPNRHNVIHFEEVLPHLLTRFFLLGETPKEKALKSQTSRKTAGDFC